MSALEVNGLDFPTHARQALSDVLGPAASETFAFLLGKEAFHDPGLFAREVARFLGGGSLSICNVLAKRAIEDFGGSEDAPAVKALEARMPHFELSAKFEPPQKETPPLHDHRIKDELGNYAEDS